MTTVAAWLEMIAAYPHWWVRLVRCWSAHQRVTGRMVRPCLAMLAAILCAPTATAQTRPAPPAASTTAGGLFSAGQLRDRCQSSVPADASYCFAYVAGVHDTVRAYEAWLNLREFCAPRHVPQGELRRAFIDYVSAHSDTTSGEAASVVVVALKVRYPCTSAPAAGLERTAPRP